MLVTPYLSHSRMPIMATGRRDVITEFFSTRSPCGPASTHLTFRVVLVHSNIGFRFNTTSLIFITSNLHVVLVRQSIYRFRIGHGVLLVAIWVPAERTVLVKARGFQFYPAVKSDLPTGPDPCNKYRVEPLYDTTRSEEHT